MVVTHLSFTPRRNVTGIITQRTKRDTMLLGVLKYKALAKALPILSCSWLVSCALRIENKKYRRLLFRVSSLDALAYWYGSVLVKNGEITAGDILM